MGTSQNVDAWLKQANTTSPQGDTDAPWTENTMTRVQINNYARSNMSAVKKKFDDLGGDITAGGTADVITLTTNSSISLAHLDDGFRIGFWAAGTNTVVGVTVNIDGVGAKTLKRADGTALAVGSIVSGMFVDCVYEAGAGVLCAVNIPSASTTISATVATAGTVLTLESTESGASAGPDIVLYRNSSSPADADALGAIRFNGEDDGGGTQTYALILGLIGSKAAGAEEGVLTLGVSTGGTSTSVVRLGGTSWSPVTSDGASLGLSSLMWSDLFLASGSVINFNNGDVTITHSANALAFAGGTVSFDAAPTVSGSAVQIATSAGVCKAWAKFNSAGTVAASHNITSVTKNGTGDWTVTIATDFSSANYCGLVSGGIENNVLIYACAAQAAGTFQILAKDMTNAAATDPSTPDAIFFAAFGAQ